MIFAKIETARELVLPAVYKAAHEDLTSLADKDYQGAGAAVLVPITRQANGIPLDDDNHTHNSLLTQLRALDERAIALLQTP